MELHQHYRQSSNTLVKQIFFFFFFTDELQHHLPNYRKQNWSQPCGGIMWLWNVWPKISLYMKCSLPSQERETNVSEAGGALTWSPRESFLAQTVLEKARRSNSSQGPSRATAECVYGLNVKDTVSDRPAGKTTSQRSRSEWAFFFSMLVFTT